MCLTFELNYFQVEYGFFKSTYLFKAYKEKNGNCNVPRSEGKLGRWVNKQRKAYKKEDLSEERKARLNKCGFDWGMLRTRVSWDDRFDKLKAYKEKNGNCNVPQKEGKLGRWVNTQREAYKKGKLSKERIASLKEVEFAWTLNK